MYSQHDGQRKGLLSRAPKAGDCPTTGRKCRRWLKDRGQEIKVEGPGWGVKPLIGTKTRLDSRIVFSTTDENLVVGKELISCWPTGIMS